MNVYSKLQTARVRLQESNLKKSGENKFAGFKYFELGDFLPSINKIFDELKLSSFINFTKEEAKLIIINSEKIDETIEFTCPVVDLTLKGANAIQNLGGTQTYLRRYLYMNALEIVENDEFDAIIGKDNKDNKSENKLSEAQIKRLYAIANKAGITPSQVLEVCKKDYGITKIESLNKNQYNEVRNRLESKVK